MLLASVDNHAGSLLVQLPRWQCERGSPLRPNEPCNYASNLAYYHDVTMICQHEGWNIPKEYSTAMAQGFAALAMGSSFWHGSHTLLGNIADNRSGGGQSVALFRLSQFNVSSDCVAKTGNILVFQTCPFPDVMTDSRLLLR